jgi:rhodanese-related sulfurtransferase
MKKMIQLLLTLLVTGTAVAQDKKTVSSEEFAKGIKEKNVIILDVRRPEEFKENHIDGAININWQNKEEFEAKTSKLDKSKTVYIYCLGGIRSEKAADQLLKNGFRKIIGLEGGIDAWKKADKPITNR